MERKTTKEKVKEYLHSETQGRLIFVNAPPNRKEFVLTNDRGDHASIAEILISDSWNLAYLEGRRVEICIREVEN